MYMELLLRFFLNIAHFSPFNMDYNEMSWFRHRFHQLSKIKQVYVCESWLAGEDRRRGGGGVPAGHKKSKQSYTAIHNKLPIK